MIDLDKTPVLVGGGQFTEHGVAPEDAHPLIELMACAVEKMLRSAGIPKLPERLSDLVVVNSVEETANNHPRQLLNSWVLPKPDCR